MQIARNNLRLKTQNYFYSQYTVIGPSISLLAPVGIQARWSAEHVHVLLFCFLSAVPDRMDHLLLVSPPGVADNPES